MPNVTKIMMRRPIVSKNRPSSGGPKKLPAAKGSRYQPTPFDGIL